MPRSGSTLLHFVHADDLVEAMLVTMTNRNEAFEVFNVAQRETPSIRDYLATLAAVAGVAADIRPVGYTALGLEPRSFFPFRDFPCLLDPGKLARVHGCAPGHTMAGGLAQTLGQLDLESMRTADVSLAVEDRLLASSAGGQLQP
jgi:nucleoside-diphosphate-sugar epimerase